MHVLCAPDSFKDTASAEAVARAMVEGIDRIGAGVTAEACPIADGGEGTLDVLIAALGGWVVERTVHGPRPDRPNVAARYGIVERDGRTAIIELAAAAGLALLSIDDRDPLRTTTYGVGELMRHAIETAAVSRILLTLGGSATVDAGLGIIQALGGRLLGTRGEDIVEPITGSAIGEIARIEPPRGVPPIQIACDVSNPLLGARGAARVYGPQKGATPEVVEQLERALSDLADRLSVDPTRPGMGAAGGVAYGLSLLDTDLTPGATLVLDALDFDRRCRAADLVITGEGRLDDQSTSGKATMTVARRARGAGAVPLAIVGCFGNGWRGCLGADALEQAVSLSELYGEDRSRAEAAPLVAHAAERLVRSICR